MIVPRRTLYFRCNWLCRNERRCPNISDEARTAIAEDKVQNEFVAKNTVSYSSNKKLTMRGMFENTPVWKCADPLNRR